MDANNNIYIYIYNNNNNVILIVLQYLLNTLQVVSFVLLLLVKCCLLNLRFIIFMGGKVSSNCAWKQVTWSRSTLYIISFVVGAIELCAGLIDMLL